MRGLLLDEGVLSLQVGDDLGIAGVAQPLVLVDEDVAVVLARGRDLLGDRWGHRRLGGRHASGQSSNFSCEIRS